MKNYHLDLIRATEAGAINAAEWAGRGNKESADLAATDAIRDRLNQIDFCAQIAIGEGVKDKSHGLFQGEIVGLDRSISFQGSDYSDESTFIESSSGVPNYCIAVDPIEGTTPTAKGGYEAISVIALANVGAMYQTEVFYMDKIAVGPCVAECDIGLEKTPAVNVGLVASALGKDIKHVTVCVLDRPRANSLVEELRKIGCRIKFISDCDVTACIATCVPDSGIDMYWSIGGAPEAVIAAAAMKCMGGKMQCREVEEVRKYNSDPYRLPYNNEWIKEWRPITGKILSIEDLVNGPCMFAATGITDGQLLKGVRFTANGPVTHSIAMRSESGTIRRMITEHGN
jgi:fructose-1,6-bisphosphatase/sedoheptulose 1,7-bisphosphatase-like protein